MKIDDFSREWGNFDAKIIAAFDQELQEFRLIWDEAPPETRRKMKLWLRRLASVADDRLPQFRMSLQMHISHDVRDEDGEQIYSGNAALTPRIMLRAIWAWERKREFTPNGAFETF